MYVKIHGADHLSIKTFNYMFIMNDCTRMQKQNVQRCDIAIFENQPSSGLRQFISTNILILFSYSISFFDNNFDVKISVCHKLIYLVYKIMNHINRVFSRLN